MNWYALELSCTAGAEEAAEYGLMEAGALGTEAEASPGPDGLVRVTAYFETPPQVERVRGALAEALRVYGLASSDVREMKFSEVEGRDWLAEWKEGCRPLRRRAALERGGRGGRPSRHTRRAGHGLRHRHARDDATVPGGD
jgi:ribosomal protein L11 methylase PrmA